MYPHHQALSSAKLQRKRTKGSWLVTDRCAGFLMGRSKSFSMQCSSPPKKLQDVYAVLLKYSLKDLPDCRDCQFRVWTARYQEYETVCRGAADHDGVQCAWAHILVSIAVQNPVRALERRDRRRGRKYQRRGSADFGWPDYWKAHNVWGPEEGTSLCEDAWNLTWWQASKVSVP